MSVAAINVRTVEGKTVHILNNHDGHVGSTGEMLIAFYNTFEKAKALVKCGDLYQLEQRLPSKEFIETVSREVMAGDTSKIPANPFIILDDAEIAEKAKNNNFAINIMDYVVYRFDLEYITLPLFTVENKNGRKVLSLCANSETQYKTKKGFGAGEYTYLFDQKQGKWFITDEVGNILCELEDEIKHLNRNWTVSGYLEERGKFRKKVLSNIKKLQNEFAKKQRTGELRGEHKGKTVQSELKVLHRPQSVRELNDWLRRMNVASKFRVRTVQEREHKCLAVQEFNRQGKWKLIGKCGVNDYNTVINYLMQFVPVDWPN